MSTVQEIEEAIEKLPDAEILALVDRLRERHAEAWDRQLGEDVAAGRLDFLVREAQAELPQDKTKPMDEILGNE